MDRSSGTQPKRMSPPYHHASQATDFHMDTVTLKGKSASQDRQMGSIWGKLPTQGRLQVQLCVKDAIANASRNLYMILRYLQMPVMHCLMYRLMKLILGSALVNMLTQVC